MSVSAAPTVAVVTGAGRGMGREIARLLAQRGHVVLAADIDGDAARATAEAIGGGSSSIELDVRDPDAHRAAAAAAARHGALAVWVNNAGIVRTSKPWEHGDDEVRALVETNLLGVIWGSRAAVEQMRRSPPPGGGQIVNMASMSALTPAPGITVYGATKHGVLGFSTGLAGDLRLAHVPIRVHAVCPDVVGTEMVFERIGERDSALLFAGPRPLDPGDVAQRVVELLDGDSLVVSIPRWRGALLRLSGAFPRAAMRVLPALQAVGDRRRRSRAP